MSLKVATAMNPLLPVDVWNVPTANSNAVDAETLRLQQQMQRPLLSAALSTNPMLYDLSMGSASMSAGLHPLIAPAVPAPRRLSLLTSATSSLHRLQQQQELLSPTALSLELPGRRNSGSLSGQHQGRPVYDEFYQLAAQEAAAVARATGSPSRLLGAHPNGDHLPFLALSKQHGLQQELQNQRSLSSLKTLTTSGKKKNALSGMALEEDKNGRLVLPKGYQPTQCDVLCGRDKLAFNHLGNQRFRAIIASYLPRYQQSKSRSERSKLHTEILNTVETIMGGYFLRQYDMSAQEGGKGEDSSHASDTSKNTKNKEGMRWVEVTNREKIDKVGHAIRDASAKAEKRKKGALARREAVKVSKSMSLAPGGVDTTNKSLQEELSSMRMMMMASGGAAGATTGRNPTTVAPSFLYHA